MRRIVFQSLACLIGLLPCLPAGASQEIGATVARDDSGEFSCASRKRVAVLVQAPKDLLPEARLQYAMGGELHVLCADFAGPQPAVGRKVRISFNGDAVRLVP